MIYAKYQGAITIPFGPVLDSTGAEYTGAVVGDVKISKNTGTPVALNGSATLTHKEVGVYELVLTISDISAVGQATITLSKTTYVAPPVHLIVLPAKVYDSIIGGTDNLEVDAIQWLGTAVHTATVNGVPVVQLHDSAGAGGINAPANFEDLAIVDTAGTVTYGNAAPPTAAETRTAVGLASANLDAQLALRTGYKLASDGVDLIVEETGLNLRQAVAVIAAAVAGKLSGAATTTITIKAAQEGATSRIVATCDADGNRSAITLTLPA